MLTESVSLTTAFIAGVLSFFSPCVFPLIPAYFTFITGNSIDELTSDKSTKRKAKIIISTLAYVAGFTFVFVLMGASASLIGGLITSYSREISIIGGLIIILFGIHMTGILRIPQLEMEKRIHVTKKPLRILGIFLVGMAFGAGWSPCIGPILGSILVFAGTTDTIYKGAFLLFIYSTGLAIPFILISVFINYMLSFMTRASKLIKYVNRITGTLMILFGLLLITDKMTILSNWLY